jgi:hypothetical protein
MFKFSPANTKLQKLNKVYRLRKYNEKSGKKIYSLDLLSGHSCPGANECHSKVVIIDGKKKIKDGKDIKFRCFSASQEVVYGGVYDLRKHNFDLMKSLKTESEITEELLRVFPKNVGILRFHVAGDVFRDTQFQAYCNLARENKNTLFYGYTKSLRILVNNKHLMPSNFRMIASKGGRYDSMIEEHNLNFSQVVDNEHQAKLLGLPVDTDDSHAVFNQSCALVIHNQQPQHINLRVKNSFMPA